ncbi:MAG: abortive infection family protein [Clostridia bacterium]|nr:abortive infection family protein [Clostridia bacterium]
MKGRDKMNQITEVTRRDIFDILNFGFTKTIFVDKPHPDFFHYQVPEDHEIKIHYWGRLDEISFLKRLYNLEKLPSYDSRFKNAEGDIWQHTVNNDDYELGWVFEDDRFCLSAGNDDKYLLDFLCEIFHPTVRVEKTDWQSMLEKINELLLPDGYNIYPKGQISGRNIYGWKNLKLGSKVIEGQIENLKTAFDSNYVRTQVDLMYSLIDTAPHSAIGKAKELLEICCKTILDEQKITYNLSLDLTQLMKITCESIGLSAKKLKKGVTGQDIAARILGNLGNITQGMAELRNLYGDGHGKNKNFHSLPPRYAHLAVGSSVATVHFMWDTYQERKNKT